MGLDICGKKSDKNYHYGYSGLHLIRWLGLISLGLPVKIKGEDTFCALSGGWKFKKDWYQDEEQTVLGCVQLSGKFLPNLMFHSDCEGTYTKSGRISFDDLMTGNSIGLLKELNYIKTNVDFKKEPHKGSRAVEVFNTFYELVNDEVKNGVGHIVFS